MAANKIAEGNVLPFTTAAILASGAGVISGNRFGVALEAYASGVAGQMAIRGVWSLPCDTGDTVSQHGKVWWDDTNKKCEFASASGLFLIGTAYAAKASGPVVVQVLLDGIQVTAVP